MRRPICYALLCASLFAGACSSETPTKFGTAGPNSPAGRFVVASDPSTGGGQDAVIGSIAYLATGTSAWMKTTTADTGWTPIPTPAATSTTNGLFSAANAAAMGTGISIAAYESPIIDFTTVADNISFTNKLQNSGKAFIPFRFDVIYYSIVGTATGSLIYSVGNGPDTSSHTHANVVSQTLGTVTSAGINGTTAFVPIIGTQTNAGVGGALVDGATEIVANVVQAPTGITAMTGRIIIFGYWRAFP